MQPQRPHQPTRMPTRRVAPGGKANPKALLALAGIVAVAVAVGAVASALRAPAESASNTADGTAPSPASDAAPATPAEGGEQRVSFIAVGDNLPDAVLGAYADACAGETGDGQYDYRPLYAHVKPYIEAADLAYVKQETHLGGDDIGPRGWPSFNTTDAMADAVVDTGFDLVASASNHSYDWGTYGAVEHSRSVWNAQPVAFVGTASSQEEADAIPVVERNGITFALLDYTYGVNGFDRSDLPAYAVSFIDEERIRADVARAQEAADVVLVAMHWGTENQTEPDSDQLAYAQLLADLGVDVVLGSHPHVIGPLAWVEGASGNRTLVAYSLGNFLSNHDAPAPLNELEGMLSCTFVKDASGVRVEDAAWTPLVNHCEEGAWGVYALGDYTPDLAARHAWLGGLDDPVTWLDDTSRTVVNSLGGDFPVVGTPT